MPYKDPEVQKAKKKEIRMRRMEFVKRLKERPCADCGIQYPWYVMQFDHVGEKEFNLSDRKQGLSEAKLLAEIAKCEIVCANCHAERTYQRMVLQ